MVKVMEHFAGTWVSDEQEALENMEKYFNKLFDEGCKPQDKETYFEICHTLYKDWECVRAIYVCHPRQRFYADKLKKKKKTYDRIKHEDDYRCGNSNQLNTSEHFSGLYFIHQIGEVNGERCFAVKVGQSDDVGKRMAQYKSHTPFAKHGMETLETNCCTADRCAMELRCNRYLNRFARRDITADGEWTIVSETDYDLLCEMFANEDVFSVIAEGGE